MPRENYLQYKCKQLSPKKRTQEQENLKMTHIYNAINSLDNTRVNTLIYNIFLKNDRFCRL